jgi:hypothetical protein
MDDVIHGMFIDAGTNTDVHGFCYGD